MVGKPGNLRRFDVGDDLSETSQPMDEGVRRVPRPPSIRPFHRAVGQGLNEVSCDRPISTRPPAPVEDRAVSSGRQPELFRLFE